MEGILASFGVGRVQGLQMIRATDFSVLDFYSCMCAAMIFGTFPAISLIFVFVCNLDCQ